MRVRACGVAAGANQVFKQKPWRSMAAAKHNKDRSGSESDARVARALKRDKVTVEVAFRSWGSACPLRLMRLRQTLPQALVNSVQGSRTSC